MAAPIGGKSSTSDSRDILRTNSARLTDVITSDVTRVANELLTKGLIDLPGETRDDILTTMGIPNYKKANRLMMVIQKHLAESRDPDEYLISVCRVLQGLDNNPALRRIAATMLQNLMSFSHVSQFSQLFPVEMPDLRLADTVESLYAGVIYYEMKGVENLVTFTAAKSMYLNKLHDYIGNKHSNAELGSIVNFNFAPGYDYIELKLDAPQKDPFTGWSIKPHIKPLRLYQDQIDNFSGNTRPPNCLISVYRSPTAVPVLHYGVPLEGVLGPITIFIHRSLRNISPLDYFPSTTASAAITTYQTASEHSTITRQQERHIVSKAASSMDKTIPTGALKRFTDVSFELSSAISPHIYIALSGLHAKGVIDFSYMNDILDSSETNLTKAKDLVHELERRLRNDKSPYEYLEKVCSVLRDQKEIQLTEIAELLQKDILVDLEKEEFDSGTIPPETDIPLKLTLATTDQQDKPDNSSTDDTNIDVQEVTSDIKQSASDETIRESIKHSGIYERLTKFTVDSKAYTHTYGEYGVTLIIPEGAVQGTATVWFGVCLYSDKFKFQDDYTPVTPIVWVHIDQELMKPAQLCLPHHVDITRRDDDTLRECLTVLRADDIPLLENDSCLVFEKCDDRIKPTDDKTFTLSMKLFCSLCIAKYRSRRKRIPKRYYVFVASKREQNAVYIDLCFLYDQQKCRQLVEKQYTELHYTIEDRMSSIFYFDDSVRSLSLSFNPSLSEIQGWRHRLTRTSPENITKKSINFWKIVRGTRRGERRLQELEGSLQYPPRYSMVFERRIGHYPVVTDYIEMKVNGANLTVPLYLLERQVPTEEIDGTEVQNEETKVYFKEFEPLIAHKVIANNISLITETMIGLEYLAKKMLERRIIDEKEKEEALDSRTGCSSEQRIDKLLDFLKTSVQVDPSVFSWFLQVLENKQTVRSLHAANTLRIAYVEEASKTTQTPSP